MGFARRVVGVLAMAVAFVSAFGACGDADDGDGGAVIVATTSILGDVVAELVGDAAEVVTIMPVGASPHEFQASARQAAAMRDADLLVVNGAGFEEGLLDVIDGAARDGVTVHEAISVVVPLDADADADDHDDVDHDDHDDVDPHFFTDPARMADAARGILDAVVAHVPGIDTAAVRDRGEEYLAALAALDAEVEAILGVVPTPSRRLVTNHEVFAYFADRYDFEVIGTVIPGGSTVGASARDLAALVDVIRDSGVSAIFADTSSPDDLARTLAGEVGDIDVVELFSESLGDPGSGGATYLEMVRTNAMRIAAALS